MLRSTHTKKNNKKKKHKQRGIGEKQIWTEGQKKEKKKIY